MIKKGVNKMWTKDLFGTEKPIIAMCHLQAFPGEPRFSKEKGFDFIIEKGRRDLKALQDGGVDGVMFSNEYGLPYQTRVSSVTVISMARVIGELMPDIKVPFGVDVLLDPIKSLELAVATGAKFVREIFTGVYASDFGLWNTDCGNTIRHKMNIGAENVKCLFNIVPEFAVYLSSRDIESIAKTTVFANNPDALCVSGLTAGSFTDTQLLRLVKNAVPDTIVFANTGVCLQNVDEQLSIADGAIVGTTFKIDGKFENAVEQARVKAFMDKVKSMRK